jgi:hypothetical protein
MKLGWVGKTNQAEQARLRGRGACVGHRLHLPPQSLGGQPIPNTSSITYQRQEKKNHPAASLAWMNTTCFSSVLFSFFLFFGKKTAHSSHYGPDAYAMRASQPMCKLHSESLTVAQGN